MPMVQANAQDSDAVTVRKLRDAALDDRFDYRFVETLTTTIGQRRAGTEAQTRAALLAESTLLAAGFENVHRDTFPITAWIRGREEAEITAPSSQRLVVAALGRGCCAVRFENTVCIFIESAITKASVMC